MITIHPMPRQSDVSPNVLNPDLEEGGAVAHFVRQVREGMVRRGFVDANGEPSVTALHEALGGKDVLRWQTVQMWVEGRGGKDVLKSLPTPERLAPLARVLDMTIDDLIAVASGIEPGNGAWLEFVETAEGKSMSPRERRLAARYLPAEGEPTVMSYQLALMAIRAAKKP